MGGNQHGLYHRPSNDATRSRFNMGNCWSSHQVSTFYTSSHNISRGEILWVICFPDRETAWSTQDYNLRSRTTVHSSFLGALTPGFGNQANQKFSIPSTNFRTDGASKPNLGRFAKSLCYIFQGFVGEMVTFSWVLLQQQLSSKHQDGSVWSLVWQKI